MLILIATVAGVFIVIYWLNLNHSFLDKLELSLKGIKFIKEMAKYVLGFATVSLMTYFGIKYFDYIIIGVAVAVVVVLASKLVWQTIQSVFHKNAKFEWLSDEEIARNNYFDEQIAKTKVTRIKHGLPHYRGSNYQRYLASWTWRIISRQAMAAMKSKCEFCGEPAYAVHHVRYPNRGELGLEDIASLCVVCKHCHDVLHGLKVDSVSECCLCNTSTAIKTLPVIKWTRPSRQKSV